MKVKTRLLITSVALIVSLSFIGTGRSWGDDPSSDPTEASTHAQTILARADGTAQAPAAEGQTPAQEATTPSAPSSTTTTTPETTEVPVTEVEVKAEKEKKPLQGTAEDGYRVDSVTVGPLGNKNPMDTPYTINVVPGELIENQQATTMQEALQYLPTAKFEERFGPNIGRPQTRGFESSVSDNIRIDGMSVTGPEAYPLEAFDRIEVLNGLAGSLYGPANPAGIFNYVLKRPTAQPFEQFFFGYNTNDQLTYHADVGGPIGQQFGYRVNLLYSDGSGFVEQGQSNLLRKLGSATFDWHISSNTVAELNFFYYHQHDEGYPAQFGYASNIELPGALDPARRGYGQDWAGVDTDNTVGSLKIKHDFNDDWHLTAGYSHQYAIRNMDNVVNTLTDNKGDYKTTFQAQQAFEGEDGSIVYLNGHAETWGITHDLIFGTSGMYEPDGRARILTPTFTLGTANILSPVSYNEPPFAIVGHSYKSSQDIEQAATVGDTVTFNKSWSLMGTVSYNWIDVRNFAEGGAETSKYYDDGISPAAALMYKPLKNMMAYFLYADSLEQGATAPATAANANQTLPAYRSEQYETGLKYALDKINLTTAMFRINRPFPYTGTDNVFRVQGDQVNYGLELMAIGEVIDRVTIYGGVTLLDPKLGDTGKYSTTGKQVVGVPKEQGNLLVEYRAPFLTGLTPFVNLHYTGRQPANDSNTTWANPYSTVDLGARYNVQIKGVETTFRLAMKNLTNERYWASIMPGSTDGTGAASTAWLGAPREIYASVQVNF